MILFQAAIARSFDLTCHTVTRQSHAATINECNGSRPLCSAILLVALLTFTTSHRARASDHADPTNLSGPETNITDLFFFPKDDRLILIFNVRRALTTPPPYDLQSYSYAIHFDLTSAVDFSSAANRARYGGTITEPAKLHADATIRIRLNDDASLQTIDYEGLSDTSGIQSFFGVRDDPFNFPRFYGVNTVAMVMSLPRSAFPAGQQDFILWGTTSQDGEQIDHVGRSIRTQLPRFGFLNTKAPGQQVEALMDQAGTRAKIYNFLRNGREWWGPAFAELMEFTFLLRSYDHQPDVMIYSDRFATGYPNGRLLTDDVVAQTCSFGDCLLQEISFIEGGFPRSMENDKPFSPDFPFLADPWPDKAAPVASRHSLTLYLALAAIVLVLLCWLLARLVHFLFRQLRHLWRDREHGDAR